MEKFGSTPPAEERRDFGYPGQPEMKGTAEAELLELHQRQRIEDEKHARRVQMNNVLIDPTTSVSLAA